MNRLMGRIRRMVSSRNTAPNRSGSTTNATSKTRDIAGAVEQGSAKNTSGRCGASGDVTTGTSANRMSTTPTTEDFVTYDDVMRVRRHECRLRGHDWDILKADGHEDPVALICDNCGRQLLVVE